MTIKEMVAQMKKGKKKVVDVASDVMSATPRFISTRRGGAAERDAKWLKQDRMGGSHFDDRGNITESGMIASLADEIRSKRIKKRK